MCLGNVRKSLTYRSKVCMMYTYHREFVDMYLHTHFSRLPSPLFLTPRFWGFLGRCLRWDVTYRKSHYFTIRYVESDLMRLKTQRRVICFSSFQRKARISTNRIVRFVFPTQSSRFPQIALIKPSQKS